MRTFIVVVALTLAGLGAGASAAELGPEVVLPASPRPAHDPCVSYGDGKYLAVGSRTMGH